MSFLRKSENLRCLLFFFAEKIVKSRRVKLHILMQTRKTFQCYDISENRHRNYILACIQMSVGQKTIGLYSEYTRVKTRKKSNNRINVSV